MQNAHVVGICPDISSSYVPDFNNCYWNAESEQIVNDVALKNNFKIGLDVSISSIRRLTTVEKKISSNFADWDFTTVWNCKSDINNAIHAYEPERKRFDKTGFKTRCYNTTQPSAKNRARLTFEASRVFRYNNA